jgi:hypothetical protein
VVVAEGETPPSRDQRTRAYLRENAMAVRKAKTILSVAEIKRALGDDDFSDYAAHDAYSMRVVYVAIELVFPLQWARCAQHSTAAVFLPRPLPTPAVGAHPNPFPRVHRPIQDIGVAECREFIDPGWDPSKQPPVRAWANARGGGCRRERPLPRLPFVCVPGVGVHIGVRTAAGRAADGGHPGPAHEHRTRRDHCT